MAIRLNVRGYEHARQLIADGKFTADLRDKWSEHRPATTKENEFIAQHGIGEYARWYLGVDEEHPPNTKAHYAFPIGDFENVHRCGVLSAEVRAGQYKNQDIETAAAHLHGEIDALARTS